MTREELDVKLGALKTQFEDDTDNLMREYADANNPYVIGDVVQDHIGRLKITAINYYLHSHYDTPCCIYYGSDLKKDGTPKIRQTNRGVYQVDIIEQQSEK